MFHLVQPLMKGELGVVGFDDDGLLRDDRTVIDPFVDEVHRHAAHLHAVLEGVRHGRATRKGGEQGGMDVEDPARKAGERFGAQDSHEPGEDERLRPGAGGHLAHVMGEAAPISGPVDHHRRDVGGPCSVEGTDARTIRDHHRDLIGWVLARLVDERLEIRARSRHQHRNPDGSLRVVVGECRSLCHRSYRGPMLDRWALDPHTIHLNHGSFGATPRAVLDAQRRFQERFEANPTGFIEDDYQEEIDQTRRRLAAFVGTDPVSIAFVTNATTGVASVVGSLELASGDELLTTDHAYNACRNIIDARAAQAGATVTTAPVEFPDASPDQVAEAVLSRVTGRTRLVVLDHVTSPTALVLPVEKILADLEPQVPVLVDGAHAPGMLPLDLDALGASYYTGNLHKWVCAPKGAGFLHVAERHRDSIRPPVISHGWNTPRDDASLFHRLFDWAGTFDPSAWLAVPVALDEVASMDPDGWPGVMRANWELALAARDLLCDRLSIRHPAPDVMIGSMAAVPLSGAAPGLARRLRAQGIVATIPEWPRPGSFVLRVSAQRYNTLSDYERLADALAE